MIIRSLDYIQRARAKRDKYKEWHDWFAWYPVRVDSHRKIWLETVSRKINYIGEDLPRFYGWEYTFKENF